MTSSYRHIWIVSKSGKPREVLHTGMSSSDIPTKVEGTPQSWGGAADVREVGLLRDPGHWSI